MAAQHPYTEHLDIRHSPAWFRLKQALLRLKRALDVKEPFDFVTYVGKAPILLIGEGNLSFSASLLRRSGHSGRQIIATTFEPETTWTRPTVDNARHLRRQGALVRGAVDATRLKEHVRGKTFELIVFQFPNVGSRVPRYGRNPNHILVRHFLRSAGQHLEETGQIVITTVNSSYYDGAFDMDGAAEASGFEKPVAHPFHFPEYPGYAHVNTLNDESAVDGETEFVTLVFKPKRHYK